MLCCAPLHYKWHIFHLARDITTVERISGHKWAQYMVSLINKDIIWFPQILNRKDMIISHGGFPNVPLIGSRGCITYNPILDMRQLGHPLPYNPEDKLLEGFVLQEATMNNPTVIKIIHARKQLNKVKGSLKRPR